MLERIIGSSCAENPIRGRANFQSPLSMIILNAADVRAALPMPDAIEAMREAFTAVSAGTADFPLRTHIDLPDGRGVTLTMSAATTSRFRDGPGVEKRSDKKMRKHISLAWSVIAVC